LKSNLVTASASSFNYDLHLVQHGIKFTDSGTLLRIKWSKTRQCKEGIHIIPLSSISNSSLCPVLAIHHYFTLVPAPSVAPFFCLPTSHSLGSTPLTATYFTTSLKRLIASLGVDPANYSPHSFRQGGANYAHLAPWSFCPQSLHPNQKSVRSIIEISEISEICCELFVSAECTIGMVMGVACR